MTGRRQRILVAIPHHGSKNRPFLDRIVSEYQSMDHDVTIVVLVEVGKPLPDGVEMRVGAPTENPWSLPFAHRSLFAQQIDDYDLFIYSEDDTLVEQRHIDTFLELDAVLPDTMIPGFQRYEVHPSGARSYCSIHSHYRWDPGSVAIHGGLTFARFTNDHAAVYMATRAQLRRAIASGGYLVPPHEGQYDMLVSAATDIYTQCGLSKMLCIDRIDDLLLHHLPNVYLGRMGIDEQQFRTQLSELLRISASSVAPQQLVSPETRLANRLWDRRCYPVRNSSVLELLPPTTRRVLSLGTASGATEAVLVDHGIEVVGIPVDTVLGAHAALHGIRVVEPRLPSAEELAGQEPFDVLLAVDILGYFAEPVEVLRRLRPALALGGLAIASAPAHHRYRIRNTCRAPAQRHPVPTSYEQAGVWPSGRTWLPGAMRSAGFDEVRTSMRKASRVDPLGHAGRRARLTGNTVLATGRRSADLAAIESPPGVGQDGAGAERLATRRPRE